MCNLIRFQFSQLEIPTVTYSKLAQLRHFQIDDDDEEEDAVGVDENGEERDHCVDGNDDNQDVSYCNFYKRHFKISTFHLLQNYPYC